MKRRRGWLLVGTLASRRTNSLSATIARAAHALGKSGGWGCVVDEGHRLYMQVYNLPGSEEAARARLEKLRNKAHGLGVLSISKRLDVVCDAWDREVRMAQLEAAQKGQENSMGVDHAN